VFGVLLQYPGSDGVVSDVAPVIERAHAAGAQVALATDLLALTMLKSPGELGADVAFGAPRHRARRAGGRCAERRLQAARSASASRWATAARTRPSSRRSASTCAPCPDAWWV
jgi:hypothetical protein